MGIDESRQYLAVGIGAKPGHGVGIGPGVPDFPDGGVKDGLDVDGGVFSTTILAVLANF